MKWQIPLDWRVSGTTTWTNLQTNTQTHTIVNANGGATLTKSGHTTNVRTP